MIGAISEVPLAGGVVSAFVGELWGDPLQKRQQTLFEEVLRRIARLETPLDPGLLHRDAVLTAVTIGAQASFAADDEKIRYLANALMNVILDPTWEHDVAAAMLRLVDEMTASHIRILDLLCDPGKWAQRHGVQFRQVPRGGSYYLRDTIEDAFAQVGEPLVGKSAF